MLFYKRGKKLRDRDMPVSNTARMVFWRIKMMERRSNPAVKFPIEIYHPGD